VILIDANLLIYAVNADAPLHAAALTWLEETLSGTRRVGLAWTVLLAFLRITTRPGIFRKPQTPEDALAYVDSWLELPIVEAIGPGAQHWSLFRNLVELTGMAGNLTTDAHLAALALERGGTVFSTDNDFKRFPGVRHVNPLS
jgi:uncharacterized protein